MEKKMRKGSHTVSRLTCHLVWVTKYRYHVLKGDVQERCRELIIQVCEVEEVEILKGVVSKDHIYIHIEHPPRTPALPVQGTFSLYFFVNNPG